MSFSDNVLGELVSMDWPGNVRELRHYVQRLALQSADSIITETETETVEQIPHEIHDIKCINEGEIIPFEQLERKEIEKAYLRYDGQIERVSVALGISRATLYRKLKLYGMI
jgi:sigma-54 dependent transcriptional regulator, acetoin dehydrogenase operon transcriptional activator AcoR